MFFLFTVPISSHDFHSIGSEKHVPVKDLADGGGVGSVEHQQQIVDQLLHSVRALALVNGVVARLVFAVRTQILQLGVQLRLDEHSLFRPKPVLQKRSVNFLQTNVDAE